MNDKKAQLDADKVSFTLQGILRGLAMGQALAIMALVYGLAFGLLAQKTGLSTLESLLMSGAVYSGSAQLAALISMEAATPWTSASIWVVASTILIVNARYLLYGATLRPWLGNVSPFQAYSTLFILADGNWIVSMRAYDVGERDAGFVFGSGLAMFLGWLAGTAAGSLAGALISNPSALGIDFFLVSICAASGIAMFKGRQDMWIVVVAAVVAFTVSRLASGGWAIIAAGLSGALVAYFRHFFSKNTS